MSRHAAAIAGGWMIALAVVAAQQPPRFKARRDIVRVDALVTEHGWPVAGLAAADFEVRDNGVIQNVDFVLSDETPINAILALDLSESVAGDRLEQLRQANHALVGALRTDDRTALIGFTHAVRLRAPLTTDRASVLGALQAPGGFGGTALFDASYSGLVLGDTDQGRSLMIVFSDGVDTASWLTADAVHDAAQRAGMVAYAVTLPGSRPEFLRDLASETGGSVFEAASGAKLGTTFVKVIDEFRHRYVLAYSPTEKDRAGWHRVQVRVKSRGGISVKTRPGYQLGTLRGNAPAVLASAETGVSRGQ
jgi:VWFA-related protein